MHARVFAARAATLTALGSLAIAPLTGCTSASSTLPGAPSPNTAALASTAPATASHALGSKALATIPDTKQKLLFVSDNENNRISVFDAATTTQNPPPLYTITNGISGPNGLATDKMGNLYVANYVASNVTVYAPHSTSPKTILSTGLNGPYDVKADSFGNVFVANNPVSGATAFILEYPPGNSSPSAGWNVPAQGMVISGIASIDPKITDHGFYAAEYTLNGSGFATGGLLDCEVGFSTCTQLSGYTFGQTGGIAVEQSPGYKRPYQFMVADQYVPGIDIYTPPNPVSQLVTGGTPEFITMDSTDKNLYVADRFYGRVVKYSYPGKKQVNTYAGGAQVYGVATYPTGSLH